MERTVTPLVDYSLLATHYWRHQIMLKLTLRSRWFSAALHAGLWLLFVMGVAGLGGRGPQFAETDADPLTVNKPVPVAKLERLFAPENWPRHVVDPASQNVFATLHFKPPVVTIPPPTTRRIELTYQGFYQSVEGPQRTLLRLGEDLVAVPVGGVVVSNLWVASAGFKTLSLTNSAGQTNALTVSVKQVVEVPLP